MAKRVVQIKPKLDAAHVGELMDDYTGYPVEQFSPDQLKPHPRNYRDHPQDQIDHLIQSIKENGFYRNVVVANDNTILAGHGVVKAAKTMGLKSVPVIRLPIAPDHPKALKVLAGDNGIGHLAEQDDRQLTELLKEIKQIDVDGLMGTGFDDKMLANLVYVTRPKSEINSFDEASHWVGMPDFENAPRAMQVMVNFKTPEDRAAFAQLCGYEFTDQTKSVWFPDRDHLDVGSVIFE